MFIFPVSLGKTDTYRHTHARTHTGTHIYTRTRTNKVTKIISLAWSVVGPFLLFYIKKVIKNKKRNMLSFMLTKTKKSLPDVDKK